MHACPPGFRPGVRPGRDEVARRRLSPEEQALWQRLARTVSPLSLRPPPVQPDAPEPVAVERPPSPKRVKGRVPPPRLVAPTPPPPRPPRDAVLDRSWEKRIRSGALQPEASVDLHNHSLAAAHAVLNDAIDRAVRGGTRVLLVITGKPRPAGGEGRGAIRAQIGDWLERSPHADRIASVRVAHPRHGGSGALYVIFRRAGR